MLTLLIFGVLGCTDDDAPAPTGSPLAETCDAVAHCRLEDRCEDYGPSHPVAHDLTLLASGCIGVFEQGACDRTGYTGGCQHTEGTRCVSVVWQVAADLSALADRCGSDDVVRP